MRLAGQTAIVTGGSRGIGRGIAERFAQEGAKVAVVYKGSQAAADECVAKIAAAGGTAKAVQCDVADLSSVKACVEAVEKDYGAATVLVNNAGVIADGLFVRMEPADWDKVLATNLGGTFNFCHVLATPMMRARKGRIINITSVSATFVNKGQTNYAASKGAVNSFTKTLALELAGRGVTVNAIAPGFIETDMSAQVRNMGGDALQKMIPMKRYGQPDDIAKMAAFLASDEASYITGQVITVDGGLSLGAAGAG
ncbi:MAG: 3-oxoacyl-ACP reductase FabG [Gemmataceae bacterium]|nr:3-oxoacyl-ACP reductase FabG [Gemmataceae bacterium]